MDTKTPYTKNTPDARRLRQSEEKANVLQSLDEYRGKGIFLCDYITRIQCVFNRWSMSMKEMLNEK